MRIREGLETIFLGHRELHYTIKEIHVKSAAPAAQYREDTTLLEPVQQRAPKMIKGVWCMRKAESWDESAWKRERSSKCPGREGIKKMEPDFVQSRQHKRQQAQTDR